MNHICYIDESGTADIPGTTSHFILAGLSIPVFHWRDCDREIGAVKRQYDLDGQEIHTAWLLRRYAQQGTIANFERLPKARRITEVNRMRHAHLLRLQNQGKKAQYRQARKNYRKTEAYIHLTEAERRQLVVDLARVVSGWGFARLFAECVDKLHFDPLRGTASVDEQAFEQVVSRFETFLTVTRQQTGLLVHDNNDTAAARLTELMRTFHRSGTLFTQVEKIIETPLFVDSALTDMVQIADLCSYALRRYLENNESELFDLVYTRADRRGNSVVGVRHFTSQPCPCSICANHR